MKKRIRSYRLSFYVDIEEEPGEEYDEVTWQELSSDALSDRSSVDLAVEAEVEMLDEWWEDVE